MNYRPGHVVEALYSGDGRWYLAILIYTDCTGRRYVIWEDGTGDPDFVTRVRYPKVNPNPPQSVFKLPHW